MSVRSTKRTNSCVYLTHAFVEVCCCVLAHLEVTKIRISVTLCRDLISSELPHKRNHGTTWFW